MIQDQTLCKIRLNVGLDSSHGTSVYEALNHLLYKSYRYFIYKGEKKQLLKKHPVSFSASLSPLGSKIVVSCWLNTRLQTMPNPVFPISFFFPCVLFLRKRAVRKELAMPLSVRKFYIISPFSLAKGNTKPDFLPDFPPLHRS